MDEPNDFVSFVEQLVAGEELDGAAAGIAAKVVSDGDLSRLSAGQYRLFIKSIKDWISEHFDDYNPGFLKTGETPPTPECTEGKDEVPWCEAYLAGVLFDGRCTWCQQLHHKEDD